MSDIACIYEMNMIEENREIDKDILSGRGMEVLFCLLDNAKTKLEIASRLGMSSYSVHLYLSRLEKAGLIKENLVNIKNGQVEKSYSLVSDEIEIINYLQSNNKTDLDKKRKWEISAQHFTSMTKKAIGNIDIDQEKPNKMKAYFMKATEQDMKIFKKEIDALFEKYQSLENKSAKDTYSLFTILAPYEMED